MVTLFLRLPPQTRCVAAHRKASVIPSVASAFVSQTTGDRTVATKSALQAPLGKSSGVSVAPLPTRVMDVEHVTVRQANANAVVTTSTEKLASCPTVAAEPMTRTSAPARELASQSQVSASVTKVPPVVTARCAVTASTRLARQSAGKLDTVTAVRQMHMLQGQLQWAAVQGTVPPRSIQC